MLPHVVHWLTAAQEEGELVSQLVLRLYQSVCQLVVPRNPSGERVNQLNRELKSHDTHMISRVLPR